MVLSNIRQKAVNIPTNVDAGCLNSRYDLVAQGEDPFGSNKTVGQAYLWNNFKPSIHFHTCKPSSHSVTDFIVSSVLEP